MLGADLLAARSALAARPAAGVPLETQQEAFALPEVRAIYDEMNASTTRGVMAARGHQMLTGACERAGVRPGAFEDRIMQWLAGFGPQECAVFAGLITPRRRQHAHHRAAGDAE